jgi:hypothetical protein
LREVTQAKDAKSLLFEYNDSQMAELRKGLEAPLTEFASQFAGNHFIAIPGVDPKVSNFQTGSHQSLVDCTSPRRRPESFDA